MITLFDNKGTNELWDGRRLVATTNAPHLIRFAEKVNSEHLQPAVLMCGLGLGVFPAHLKPGALIDTIESNRGVVAFNLPPIGNVFIGDAFAPDFTKLRPYYDVILFDVFDIATRSQSHLNTMHQLKCMYQHLCPVDGVWGYVPGADSVVMI